MDNTPAGSHLIGTAGDIGAIEIGILCSVILYGMATLQTILYHIRFKRKDSRPLRTIIGIIWFAGLGHSVFACWTLYTVTIRDYNQSFEELSFPSTIIAAVLFGSLIQPLVQAVYAARVYQFSKRWFIPAVCWCISANIFGSTALLSYKALVSPPLTEFEKEWTWLIAATLTATAIVDVLISASMCYHLHRHRGLSYQRSSLVLNKLIIWTMQTGLITSLSITAIASTVTFILIKHRFIWLAIFMVLTGLYSNALLALLNGRWQLSGHYDSTLRTLSNPPSQLMLPLQHITFTNSDQRTQFNSNLPYSTQPNSTQPNSTQPNSTQPNSTQPSPQSPTSGSTSIAFAHGMPNTPLPSPPANAAHAGSSRYSSPFMTR
ncbi:hypothetical protein HGRIS_010940 [Hohenbuehelia grisea]|uniref:DUF6534 domain-containing protein n=1 Tax=Hohenbuehelia grisea TaxID=104357 RepID=A0ABR3IYD4_9AGAR